jgi:hypothetical protein
VGLTVADATARLQESGLAMSAVTEASSKPAGVVLYSSPSADETVPAGSTVKLTVAREKQWQTVGTYHLDSEGSAPPVHITGDQWRITYTLEETGCPYVSGVECSYPYLEIDSASDFNDVQLSEGTHTFYGPGGRGTYRLTMSIVDGSWDLNMTVEQLA